MKKIIKVNKKTEHILVVDDDEMTLHLVKFNLEDIGLTVRILNDSRLVFERIRPGETKLVLLDLMMPYLNGRKLLRRLKQSDKTKNIPVVLISSSHDIDNVSAKYKADGYLEKPLDMKKLENIVKKKIAKAEN